MTYKVYVAHTVACGFCQMAMRQDDPPPRGEMHSDASVVVRCWNMQCEQYDVPLVYPLEVRELQRAE